MWGPPSHFGGVGPGGTHPEGHDDEQGHRSDPDADCGSPTQAAKLDVICSAHRALPLRGEGSDPPYPRVRLGSSGYSAHRRCHNGSVIPTMIVFGFVFGRWWRWSILAGGIVWVVLLLASRWMGGSHSSAWVGAILLGVANTAVGAGLFLLARLVVRMFRPARGSAASR
jgi:hypothetical protein